MPEEPSAIGLDGRKFFPPSLTAKARARIDSNFFAAEIAYKANPSEENIIWYGRREAYRYNYRNAVKIFTEGLKMYPQSYRLLRHRGHRYITLRDFDKAISDLTVASALMPSGLPETEPDGLPNKLNIPLSTTQFNIWYHLGLAYYLKGDFAKAEKAYLECLKVSSNDDLLTATADWLYMTYRRSGKNTEAENLIGKIHEGMKIIENDSYFKRLMMYKGKLQPGELLEVGPGDQDPDLAIATQGYGVGNWYLYNGDTAKAKEVFLKVVSGNHFSAFGFIAAESDLKRLK